MNESSGAPKVSVVIPLYNKEDHIAAAIQSVLDQDFTDLEVIVVNDGSTDGSAQAVQPFLGRIVYEKQPNSGPSAARNHGIQLARGEFIAFLDADDEWLADKLAGQAAYLESHPEVMWCGTNVYVDSGQGLNPNETFANWNGQAGLEWETIDDWFLAMIQENVILTSGVVVSRSVFQEVGGFDTNIPAGQDMELWIRIASHFPRYGYCRQPLVRYNSHIPGCISLAGGKKYASMLTYLGKHVNRIQADGVGESNYKTFVISKLHKLIRESLITGHKAIAKRAIKTFPDGCMVRQKRILGVMAILPSWLLVAVHRFWMAIRPKRG